MNNIQLNIWPSSPLSKEEIRDILDELTTSGYTGTYMGTHFEATNTSNECDEPEVLFDSLLLFDSKITVHVNRCNEYTLRKC